jgi:hypothetical protein
MNAIFHHTVVADVDHPPSVTPPVASEDGMNYRVAADHGRMYGHRTAPRTLDIIIDLTCRHCAEQYQPLFTALQPTIQAGQVRVIVHHLIRPSQPAARPATELVFAAAALDQHAIALDVLLGSNPDASASGLTNRLAEVIDIAKLSPLLTTYQSDLNAVISEDQIRITQLELGPRTPAAALTENGRITHRWSGNLPIAGIMAALAPQPQ